MAFVAIDAGYLNIVDNYLPKKLYLLAALSIVIMALVAIILVATIRLWVALLNSKEPVRLPDDAPVLLQAGKPLAKTAAASAD
jgi:carbon starvation protein